MKDIHYLYIADGHHRTGAMEYIYTKNPINDKFMIAAFPSNESKIFDYNREIKDLNGLSKDQFIENYPYCLLFPFSLAFWGLRVFF